MFQVDDYVVYGSCGVCKVLEIGIPDIQGIDRTKSYYTLQPVNSNGSIIYIPVENNRIRGIISREDAMNLINDIPNIDIIMVPNEKMRDAIFKESMKKNDCREWIKIIKTLYIKNQQRIAEGKKVGSSDLRYLHEAEECLYSELSIPLKISKDNMEEFITNKVKLLNI